MGHNTLFVLPMGAVSSALARSLVSCGALVFLVGGGEWKPAWGVIGHSDWRCRAQRQSVSLKVNLGQVRG